MHAHLSGSVKESTVIKLLEEEAAELRSLDSNSSSTSSSPSSPSPSPPSDELRTFQFGDRSLSECFHVFRILHRLLSTVSAVCRVTREVITDFAADGTVYLELRTTPRALHKEGTSKRQYVEGVVQAIRDSQRTVRTPAGFPIVVRLLLSIDRSQSFAEAESTLALAVEFAAQEDPIVVGLDFSGNVR